jgi:hypothetical protein
MYRFKTFKNKVVELTASKIKSRISLEKVDNSTKQKLSF